MKVKIFAPSYKRPEKAKTQMVYPGVTLVVCESQAEEYKKNGNNIVVCPDSAQGNLCRVRNWILDNLFEDNDCLILLDDDCSYIGYWNNQKQIRFNNNELIEFCEKSALLCDELGYKFFGLNCIMDKGAYREYTPLGFTQYIGGPFQAHLKNSPVRYDEQLSLKEDYDITLQHIYKYGGCLRINYAHYNVKQAEQTGGCATYRNLEEEKRQFKLLQKKWGKDIITQDKGSKRSFDFNPILKVPINGV
tara:strand:- start:11818 stop:12558 length:741 start_codon:yes stop_codon:yes gene_type:complete